MNASEYKTRFIRHMTDLNVGADLALAEYEAHIETYPDAHSEDPPTPEDDAEEAMSYWED